MKKILLLATMAMTSNLNAKSLYDYEVFDIEGRETTLAPFKGKVILIVNVASKCGFTRQYKGLEELYAKYKTKGLVICGFPCNQFGSQEPASEKEIKEFCTAKFGVTFPMFSKIEVNGSKRHPIYEFLIGKNSQTAGNVKWNFTKILVGKNGEPVDRFGSITSPTSGKLRKAIEKALEE
ncbi:MAG: glutathione peroxidase [Opitutae bacterium]|jgi:glutathione peroxidase|nr:glutathione peroxidase [Opitutae bacterium]